jgi:3-phenylpropionate/trans-cinnamate dioxygenase ferredoxin subunit
MGKFVVGLLQDLPPGTTRRVEAGGRAIALFNVEGTFFALRDVCPHQGAPLSNGTVVGSISAAAPGCYDYDHGRKVVKCPWHGWEYELKTGQSWFDPANSRVRPYEVSVESGGELNRRPERVPGPYVAETVSVWVEDGAYVVVEV